MKDKSSRAVTPAELRRKAEALYLKKTPARGNPAALPHAELKRILHELRVHQIELEMQNEELRRAQAALDAQRERYFDLYDLAPVGYLTISAKGLITLGNLTAAALLGEPRGALAGRPFSRFVHENHQNIFYLSFKQLFKTGQPQVFELRLVKKDGTAFWARVEAALAPDAAGAQVCRAVLSDVDANKRAEEVLRRDSVTLEKLVGERTRELLAAQEELQKARRLADIGTLAATVAHEMRNPLAAIKLAVHNLKRNSGDPAKTERHYAVIDKKVFESDHIINNLLFYSRLRAPSYESTSVSQLLRDCAALAGRYSAGTTLSLIIEGNPEEALPIQADPTQLKEVFTNLLNNACDAAPLGGKVEIRARLKGEAIEVAVTDNGTGIEKADLERVFDTFFTTKARGTGLGLTVCRQLVDGHGGSIQLKSEAGKGTQVLVTLPLRPGDKN